MQNIDILTYQYQYVYRREGHCRAYGGSRSTVEFLNYDLSVLEVTLVVRKNTHTKDGEVYWRSHSSLFRGKIEGSQTRVHSNKLSIKVT